MSGAGPCRPLERGCHKLTRSNVPKPDPAPHAPSRGPIGTPLSLGFPGSQSSSCPRLPVLSRPAAKARRPGARWTLWRPAAGGSGKSSRRASPTQLRRPDRGAGPQKGRGCREGLVGGAKSQRWSLKNPVFKSLLVRVWLTEVSI